ncbi:uncharacterized protein M421DRAFT_54158, partial [Didymella exigua CBS 183.55]
RNETVTTFLRQLEYCKDILFLTKDRVSEIDKTVASGIDLKLTYSPLSRES